MMPVSYPNTAPAKSASISRTHSFTMKAPCYRSQPGKIPVSLQNAATRTVASWYKVAAASGSAFTQHEEPCIDGIDALMSVKGTDMRVRRAAMVFMASILAARCFCASISTFGVAIPRVRLCETKEDP